MKDVPRTGRAGLLVLRERLSERDRQILSLVADLRLLCARQIQAIVFPAEQHASSNTAARCCRRVLERLTHENLLVRLERRVGGVRAGSASFIYALGPIGHRVLDDAGKRKRLAEPSARFVDHTLAVGDFLVALNVEGRSNGYEVLRWHAEPKAWREVATLGGRVLLRPDLFVVLAAEGYELRWFVEIDRGTEHLPAISRKCRLYNSYYRTGAEQRQHPVFPRVLWVTTNDRRAHLFRTSIAADRRLEPDLFRVTTAQDAVDAIGRRS